MIGYLYWILLVVVIIYLWHKWITRNYKYFEKIGLPYHKPTFLLGDLVTLILKKKSLLDLLKEVYSLYPNERVIGSFDFSNPVFLLRDPELIQKIFIKDFDHFTNRQSLNISDELIGKSLLSLNGQMWKDMRATLSPAFTGSKMRQMFELINECADQLPKFFLQSKQSKHIVEISDLFSRFTIDCIATCAFGIKVNSLVDRENDFLIFGQSFVKPNVPLMVTKFMCVRYLPKLAKLLKIQMLSNKIDAFFRSLIIDTMKIRDEQNIYRPDMIHLLMQVRKGGIKDDDENCSDDSMPDGQPEKVFGGKAKNSWPDDFLVAQCLAFFFAAAVPTPATLTFLSYELATNPDIQQKLIAEIDEAERRNPNGLTYATLQSLKYLDMVVNENLRKWPSVVMTDRVCIKDYDIYENNKVKFKIEKGRMVQILMYSLHHDPQYFPNPERFDPERFSEKNIDKIIAGTYLPFGTGPRNCIGSRLALMVLKTLTYNLLKNFTIEVCEKTQIPLKLSGFSVLPDNGLHLELHHRNT